MITSLLNSYSRAFVFLLIFSILAPTSYGQTETKEEKPKKEKFSFKMLKDPQDGMFDLSDLLIEHHGFIPVPQIITEKSLGGFGFMLAPIFIEPNKIKEQDGKPVAPNITGGFAGYTANQTWGVGAFRKASLPEYHLKYTAGAVYANVNMDFYRTLPIVGEQTFDFNFRIAGAYLSVLRQIAKTELYLGLEYFFGHNEIKPNFENDRVADFVKDKDYSSNIGSLGLDLEFDKRDNMFTPNYGWYITSEFRVNANWTGSDYNFQNFNADFIKYFQFTPKWVSGFRLDNQFQFGDAPFYLKPSIQVRGVPMAKYQGDQVYSLMTEQRYDFVERWSGIAFGGLSKAPTEKVNFNESDLIANYGGGFRYLIARKFQLRSGVDVAWTNKGDFGWYIVFGCAWNSFN
ncbi:BamA/TamA family outer membrane protein [Formosa sp. PL04]|uniref:BamA/TamA family outer membrane protein n=1 Tax=Formosa sp. PL04 TaxID=3081755 RepID=UPI002980B161|nr:BamA/TamA family outer membrane protein [Formosa sp. PL04]MDW5288939.1 BamA/TamA family outer membrane protein [Formosa sp. PL04]